MTDSLPTEALRFSPTGEILCPKCGGANPPRAIFCGNPACRKALGGFRYVIEELPGAAWHEKLAHLVTRMMSRPHFLASHFIWFLIWAALNTGLIAMFRSFDQYPFGFLGILLTAEAIFISGCVLITQNTQYEHALKRAELDYELGVQSYRRIEALQDQVAELRIMVQRLARDESPSP